MIVAQEAWAEKSGVEPMARLAGFGIGAVEPGMFGLGPVPAVHRALDRAGWSIGVPVIALAAGLLFTTTATTAGGTALREDRRPQLTQVIDERRAQVAASERRAAELRQQTEQQAPATEMQPVADPRRSCCGTRR